MTDSGQKNRPRVLNRPRALMSRKKGEDMDKLKILVVDDESRMRKLVRDFLVKKDFEVMEAGDGAQALDLFYADKDIALIILDVMMPKMDG